MILAIDTATAAVGVALAAPDGSLVAATELVLAKRHVEHPGVVYERVTHIRATSPARVPYETDGEAAGWLPVEIGIQPAAIRVKVPPAPRSG